MEIIVKNYAHYNRAMDKYITSKRHYEQEMAKGGFVPFDKAEQMAESARGKLHKPYVLSEKTKKFLGEVKQMSDRKGRIHPSERFIKGLQEHGVKVDCQYDKLPRAYQKGGFE